MSLGRLVLAAAIGSLAFGVAACGGDKDSGLSNSAYVAKADPVCKVSPQGPQTQDPKATARFLEEKLIPFRKKVVADLRKLEPNEDLKPKVDAFLAASEKVNGLFSKQVVPLKKGDVVSAQDLDVPIAQAQAERNKAAGEVGYKKCGQPLQGPPVTAGGFESEEVLEPADAACKEATDVTLANKPADLKPRTIAESTEKTLPAQKKALATLKSLESKATKPDYKKFVVVEEQRYKNALELVRIGKTGDQAGFDEAAMKDFQTYEQGLPTALRLGFTVCGVSSPLGF